MMLVTMLNSDPEEAFVFKTDAGRRAFAAGYTTGVNDVATGVDAARAVLWPEEKGELTEREAAGMAMFVLVAEPQEMDL